jgi:RNA polymerase sigma-70 factor, ECF subfamily
MTIPDATFLHELPLATAATSLASNRPTAVECEVITLFDQFNPSLLRYVLSLGLPVHDAEEITQEVFLALFRHLQLGKPRHNLRGWIFRVAHNLALKQRQARQRSDCRAAMGEAVAETQVDSSPNPEEQVLLAQRQKRLLAVLHELPEQDRACLRLRAEGLRYREIARVVGISLGTVSMSLTRSLGRLMGADGR